MSISSELYTTLLRDSSRIIAVREQHQRPSASRSVPGYPPLTRSQVFFERAHPKTEGVLFPRCPTPQCRSGRTRKPNRRKGRTKNSPIDRPSDRNVQHYFVPDRRNNDPDRSNVFSSKNRGRVLALLDPERLPLLHSCGYNGRQSRKDRPQLRRNRRGHEQRVVRLSHSLHSPRRRACHVFCG